MSTGSRYSIPALKDLVFTAFPLDGPTRTYLLSALNRLEACLPKSDAEDLSQLSVEQLQRRLSTLPDISVSTAATYARRVRRVVELEESRSHGRGALEKGTLEILRESMRENAATPSIRTLYSNQVAVPTASVDPSARLTVPFPIRNGVVINIVGIPGDIRPDEVERLVTFLKAFCPPASNEGRK